MVEIKYRILLSIVILISLKININEMKSFGKKPFNKNKQTTANYNKFDIMNRRRQKTPKYKISNQKNSTQKNGYEKFTH